MTKLIITALTAALLFTGCEMSSSSSDNFKSSVKTEKEQFSYAVGTDIGASIEDFKGEIDLDALFQAISDKYNEKEPMITDSAATAVKTEVFKRIRELKDAERKKKAEENVGAQKKFLDENKTKEGVVTTESGLQYKVIKQGEGEIPTANDKVKVHYKGSLLDGKVFDSSYKRGTPATFRVGGVIKGWTEALQLMPVGSKYELYIPAELGYGARGAGKDIAPNSMLIFEVELLSIEK